MNKADRNLSSPGACSLATNEQYVLLNAKEENKVGERDREFEEVWGGQGGPWGKVTFESRLKGGGAARHEAT